MSRKEYSHSYNQPKTASRQRMNDAIKRFAEQQPERFAELQALALHEPKTPQKRALHELTTPISLNVALSDAQIKAIDEKFDTLIKQWRGDRRDYFISTVDCYGKNHLYFETLADKSDANNILQRNPKYIERDEKIVNIKQCTCPLCR